MNKSTKTTRIEKKYTDKKTGQEKSIVIDYAKVNDRIQMFRQDCPNGSITTKYDFMPDGKTVLIQATIVKDQKVEGSAMATGTAMGYVSGEKGFEKTESIATGRALALLGYAGSGEIASAEEMEEFLQYQTEKKEAQLSEATELLNEAKTVDELKNVWAGLKPEIKNTKAIIDLKESRKNAYSK